MEPTMIVILLLAGFIVVAVNRAEARNEKETKELVEREKRDNADYNNVVSLVWKGYSDEEIYSRLGSRMLSFKISDVRKSVLGEYYGK